MYDQIWFQEYRKIALLCDHQDTIVYLAQHVKLLDKYVIKQVKKNSIAYQQAIMEAKLLQILQHPCIPTLYNIYENQEYLFLVEQYMEGESLQSICQTEQLSISTILSYSIQLCSIISYLHSLANPVLHLDINPNNIIVMRDRIALIDFSASLCKSDSESNISHYGTVGFAAPEQFNHTTVDERTDIYGIGSTIDYMLDQNMSVERNSHSEYSKLRDITRRCRRKKRVQRYSRIQQVGSLLSQVYRKQVRQHMEKGLLIAVAGTQSHIGVTHTCLLLSSYLNDHGVDCLYAEMNDTETAKFMIQQERVLREDGIYQYEHIPVLPSLDYETLKQYCERFSVIVADYGILTERNRCEYERSDLRFLVYGGKVYEWPVAENCIRGITALRDIYFLNNFQTAGECRGIPDLIPQSQYFLLPYEPNLNQLKSQRLKDFFSQLIRLYLG